MEERVDAYRVLAGKPEEKRLLRRPGGNWEDNIKKYLRQFRRIYPLQDKEMWRDVVNVVMKFRAL
jgi:hypothetical protein